MLAFHHMGATFCCFRSAIHPGISTAQSKTRGSSPGTPYSPERAGRSRNRGGESRCRNRPLGWIHIALALAALAAGGRGSGWRPRGRLGISGWGGTYAFLMLGVNGTAFMLFGLFGRFGPFPCGCVLEPAHRRCRLDPRTVSVVPTVGRTPRVFHEWVLCRAARGGRRRDTWSDPGHPVRTPRLGHGDLRHRSRERGRHRRYASIPPYDAGAFSPLTSGGVVGGGVFMITAVAYEAAVRGARA